jgi:hypothetical protein
MSTGPSLPPRWLHGLGQLTRRKAASQFEAAAHDPAKAQEQFLIGLLRANAQTEFGRSHGFATLGSTRDFVQGVPLMTAADLARWSDRLRQGERHLLTAEPPRFYAITTGTAGVHKYVPVTASYQAEFQRTVAIAFWHLYRRFPGAFTSKLLYFVGPRQVSVAPDGLDVGTMSGYNFTEMGPVIRALYAWPYELFQVADLETRDYLALYLAILGDISLITGVFPTSIVALLRGLETHAEALARDLREGTLKGAANLTTEQRRFFEAGLAPRRDLARRIERAAAAPVEEKAAEAFPRLRLAYCWTTSTAGLYVPELKRRLGPNVAVRDGIYAATEAWCNVPMGDEEPGGPAAVTSVFLEFLPEVDRANGSMRTVLAHELVEGGRYFPVVTNSAGLYRYLLDDVVEVCGRYHATPRIRFLRKMGAACNLVGELMEESHATQAVSEVLGARGLEATWFCMVADPSLLRYRLYLELAPACDGLTDAAIADLIAPLEARLGEVNFSYALERQEGALGRLEIRRVPIGRYLAWRQRRVSEGCGDAQLKAVHLLSDPDELPREFTT